MTFSTLEIKILGQKFCAQKDGFRKLGHIFASQLAYESRLCSYNFI